MFIKCDTIDQPSYFFSYWNIDVIPNELDIYRVLSGHLRIFHRGRFHAVVLLFFFFFDGNTPPQVGQGVFWRYFAKHLASTFIM